jgi:hypothetical protein
MDLLLETSIISTAVISGVVLSRKFSRLRAPYWACGYFISLILITMLLTARCSTALSFLPPFSWAAASRARFIVSAWAITMGLITPLSRLPRRSEKYAVCLLAVVFVTGFSIVPFLAPNFLKGDLSTLQTKVDSNGICLQSRSYTCGPAAAVTALRKLGFNAQEGEIAVLARSSPVTGTLPRSLYSALQARYGSEGLKCRYRCFNSVNQLKGIGVTLAVVRDAFLLDHCVAVLDVSDRTVVIADPALGKQLMSHEQFERMWRFTGIVLRRDVLGSI